MAAKKERDIEFDSLLNELQDDLRDEQPIESSEGKKVLLLARTFKEQGETIHKLASSRWYVKSDTNLLDLADDLTEDQGIQAVGVVNEDGVCVGLINRRDLFDLLSRPFGRDVMRREQVDRVVVNQEAIYFDTNIFTVSERLNQFDHRGEVHYFPLKSGTGEFAGLFSSQDLLIYLSDMTQQDIALARAIQNRVVKEFSFLEKKQFEFVASSIMAKGVGGDFYHAKNYSPERWFFTLCDVSGKGVSASLITSALWGTIKVFDNRRGIAALVKTLNEFFITTFELEKYVTGVFFDLNLGKANINIADMGHGLAFILRDGKLLKVKSSESNVPVGVMEEINPEVYNYSLKPGDLILLVSDGIIEQENPRDEEFGLRRLKDLLVANQDQDLKTMRTRLLEEFHKFRNHTPLHDDVTFLMLRWKG
jgi:sigma-B regulation protein RsbU (phosphoserine phosphatase)